MQCVVMDMDKFQRDNNISEEAFRESHMQTTRYNMIENCSDQEVKTLVPIATVAVAKLAKGTTILR